MKSPLAILAVVLFFGLSPATALDQAPMPRELPALSPADSSTASAAKPSKLYAPEIAEFLGPTENHWFSVEPYAWVFSLSGSAGVRGAQLPIDQPLPDKLDELSNGAAAVGLHVEAGMGNVGLACDGFTFSEVPLNGFLRVETDTTIIELLGFYRVFCAATKEPHFSNVTFDVLAGVRYYDVTNNVTFPPFYPFSVGKSESWIDLVIGARVSVQIHDDLVAFARIDCGGFSLGESSKRATNFMFGVEYRCPYVTGSSFVAGYRIFEIDQKTGSGLNSFAYDVTLSGPFVAFKVGF